MSIDLINQRNDHGLELKERFDFASKIILEPESFILSVFNSEIEIEMKENQTPVTIADKNSEKLLREMIQNKFPEDSIIGEEYGEAVGKSPYTWTLDPIDGTKSFVRKSPNFGTMIGLLKDGEPTFGVINFPVHKILVQACRGFGCWIKREGKKFEKVLMKTNSSQKKMSYSHSGNEYFVLTERDHILNNLKEGMTFADEKGDCFGHLEVLLGNLDLMVDPLLHLWDWVPFKVIIEEAGGATYLFKDGKEKINGMISMNKSFSNRIYDWL